MELPRNFLNVQRGLALLLLAATLGVAFVERSSPFSARRRSNTPYPFWLHVREPAHSFPPALHLGVYHPLRRVLVLIHVPQTTKLQGKLTASRIYADALRAAGDAASAERAVIDLAQLKLSALSLEPIPWEGAGRLSLELEPGEDREEPAAAAARALKARGRSPRALWSLARAAAAGLRRGEKAAADGLLLTLELRTTPFESLEPALLPEDPAAPDFLARSFAPRTETHDEEKATVVEVLNGTEAAGLAAQAAKVLRSKGVDVMALGRTEHPRSRTIIFDRTGDFSRAARVRAALACPTAIATTRIDALRGVDASVELGDDCRF